MTIVTPTVGYKTSVALTISRNHQRLTGDGWGTLIQQTTANTQVFLINDGVIGTEIDHLKLKDTGTFNAAFRGRALIQVDINAGGTGNKSLRLHDLWLAAAAITGISGNTILDSEIYSNRFDADGGAFGEHGVYVSSGCKRVRIHHNQMFNVGTSNGEGITSNEGADNSVTDITVDHNRISYPSSAANQKQTRWIIDANTLIGTADSTQDGIDVFSAILTFSQITNNVAYGWQRNGLRTDAIQDSVIANNNFSGNGASGARLTGAARCLIQSNLFRDNDSGTVGASGDVSAGLRLNSANTNNIIMGNVMNVSNVSNYQKYGISMGVNQTGNYFLNNIVSSNRTADLDITGVTGNYWLQPTSTGAIKFGALSGATAGILGSGGAFIPIRNILAYAAPTTVDVSLGNEFDLTVTTNANFTISNPTNATDGQRITITVRNTSGAPMGTITWDTLYKLAAWTNPATGFSRSIDYKFDGTNWIEVSRTTVDVPN